MASWKRSTGRDGRQCGALDYTETKFKRRYGKDSEQLRTFKEACVRQFVGSFAYRLVYGLRNYGYLITTAVSQQS